MKTSIRPPVLLLSLGLALSAGCRDRQMTSESTSAGPPPMEPAHKGPAPSPGKPGDEPPPEAEETAGFHDGYDALLKKYVKDGRVDYAGLKADSAKLDAYTQSIADLDKTTYDGWSGDERLAFWINAYNALTLKLIVQHYPIDSIKKIDGAWDKVKFKVMGEDLTLNGIEHDTIRKQWSEPRVHMVLVCAAKGCPILRSEAYSADKLEDQLSSATRAYLATPAGLAVDKAAKKVSISKIFEWYGDDWAKKSTAPKGPKGFGAKEQAVLEFVAKYGPDDVKSYIEAGGYKLGYIEYDWALNAQG